MRTPIADIIKKTQEDQIAATGNLLESLNRTETTTDPAEKKAALITGQARRRSASGTQRTR